MFNLHCTKKLLDRINPQVEKPRDGTTRLGSWYATALFWKPQVALLVNERTLLPVLMPLAPAATLALRFPMALKQVLLALNVPAPFIDLELEGMSEVVYAKSTNRSVLGMLNQFSYLAEGYREMADEVDLLALSVKLSGTPCGPLYKGAVFPDKALSELVYGGSIH